MIWAFGAFEVDDDRCELRRDGHPVELRRKVFDVLHYLVRHSDRLVSKNELLQCVWPGETIHEGVIPQNITLLRKVLGDRRESAKIIQTVHGRGYRFVARVAVRAGVTPETLRTRSATGPAAPFVGRARVMEDLRASLDEALAGRGRLAIVSGEAGIGKTRTCEELAAEARARGVYVLEGRCHEGEGAPAYWPWVQILRAAAGDGDHGRLHAQLGPAASDVAHLVGELRRHFGELPRPEPLDPAQARFRLFDGITSYLSRLSHVQPLVLILDDLHWADEATLHLLRFVSREVRSLPLLVLGTTRDPETAGDATAGGVLSALVGGAHVQRIYLRGLSHADTCQLVLATVQRDPGESTLRELHALTDGNPFFVQEIVRLMVDTAAAGGDGGDGWRLELPSRVREVIGLRLQGLSPAAQRVLSLASVIGREFSLAVLEQVAGLPRAELLQSLAAAADARIVRDAAASPAAPADDAPPPHRYRFAHALIRESLYGSLNEPERVRLHEQVGRALEALFGVDAEQHLAELAQHFYRAASGGDVERAVGYCVRAAEQALGLLAFEQAVLHYRRALEALACRLPVDEQRRFELKLALGAALFRAAEDGNPALLGAAEIARRLGRPDLVGRVVLAMCGWPATLRHGRTANSELYPLLVEALAAPLEDSVLRARLLSVQALNCPFGTKVADKVALGRDALELARAVRHDEALHDALLSHLQLTHNPEDTARRLELAGELLAVAGRLGSKERVFTAHELRIQPLLALGELQAADRELETCARLAQELRLPRCHVQVLRHRLQRALGDGRFDEIRPLTDEAVRVRGQARRSPMYLITMHVWELFMHAQRGDRDWLDEHVQRMAADAHRAPLMRSHVAYLYALFGRLDEARACYAPLFLPGVLDEDRDDNWLTTLVLTADAVAACGDRAAAAELYPRLLPHAALNVAHLEMLVYFGCCAHWLGMLGALLGERAAAAEHFETALAMNAKLGARPALARTSFEYARVLLDAGNAAAGATAPASAARGRELLAQAQSLAETLGMKDLAQAARRLAGPAGSPRT